MESEEWTEVENVLGPQCPRWAPLATAAVYVSHS